MVLDSAFNVSVTPGLNSKDVAPAHGRARHDFQLGGPLTLKIWADVNTPDSGSDSFWVRMDQGAWIKWNEISAEESCNAVHNSDLPGSPVVHFNLSAGSHFLEFAYREDGTTFTNIVQLTEDLEGGPVCSD